MRRRREFTHNSKIMKEDMENLTTEDYNNIPVYYCEHCLSLAIKSEGFLDYCTYCGSTDVSTAHIDEWDKLYRIRHGGKSFLELTK